MPMRAKKPSAVLASSMLLEVAGQTAMGIALGLGFAFVLTHFPQFGIVAYIDQSFSPRDAMMMLVVTCVTTFGIGATMTGLALSRMRDIG
jgi:hypothetical protein